VHKRNKIVIISIAVVIVSMFFVSELLKEIQKNETNVRISEFQEQQKVIEKNSPSLEIIGTIDYQRTFDEPDIYLLPEPNELYKIEDSDTEKIWLEPSWINPNTVKLTEDLNGKKVRINGVIKEEGGEKVRLWTGTPIIIVQKIEVLN